MLQIYAKFTLKEGGKEAVLPILETLIENTRKEPGNICYDLFEDVEDANVVTFFEQYTDEAAIEAHSSSSYFQEAFPELEPHLAAPPVIETYRQLR
jgi:quinol monooxygenase YgiN